MSFIRGIKQRDKTYYAEVENQWINGKCVQKHIRSLGSDPKNLTTIPIEPVHFSYLSLKLMQDALTPNDLFEMLENMGQPIRKDELEKIGINYDFEKKNVHHLPLLQEEIKIKSQNCCQICKKEPDT